MNLTQALRKWAVDTLGVSADASDKEIKAAIAKAIDEGKLTPVKLVELTKEEGDDVPDLGKIIGDAVGTAVATAVAPLTKKLDKLAGEGDSDGDGDDDQPDSKDGDPSGSSDLDMEKLIEAKVEKALKATGQIEPSKAASFISKAMSKPRVKGVEERFSRTKSAAVHDDSPGRRHAGLAGRPAEYMGRQLEHPSQFDKAVAGAFFKYAISSASSNGKYPRGFRMNEQDEDLLQYALHEVPWTGIIGGEQRGSVIDGRRLFDMEIKALLDDATSGGLEAAPILFDDIVILTPVLHGELFPLVNVVSISRGRRIEAFSIGNPTITTGVAEGTQITLETTTGFIAAFDNTIFPAVGAIEIGKDFEEDSPVNIGQLVMDRFGEKMLEFLDRVIATGNVAQEPQGIFSATGAIIVTSANGTSGPASINDLEGLLFGTSKAFRAAKGSRNVFIMNDNSYRRFRGLAVGSSDARRLFGLDQSSYMMLDHPVKIQGSITNNQAAFCNLGFFRLYRRMGMQFNVEAGGKELVRANQFLITLRSRWGGRLELGGACARITDLAD